MKYNKFIEAVFLIILLSLSCPVVVLAEPGNTIVYRTKTGDCYHQYGCRYLRKSSIKTTLDIVTRLGLRPCSACDPPLLDKEATALAEKNIVKATATPAPLIQRRENKVKTNVVSTPAPSNEVKRSSEKSNNTGWVDNIAYFVSGGAITFFITYAFKKSNDN